MEDINWLLFVGGMVIGFVLCYSICDVIFPIMRDITDEDDR